MINTNRVVPVTQTDLITLYSVILTLAAATAPEKIAPTDPGVFSQGTNSKHVLCSEPVKSFNFASTATAGTVYFVASHDYEGFSLSGTKTATAGTTVVPDGRTLYKAVLSSGTITVTQVGL